MVLEALVAAALLAVLLVISLRVLAAAALERRAIEKRAVALEVAAGAIERATAVPWDQLTPERLAEIRLPPSVERILAGAKLTWTLEPAGSGPAAKHIRAELAWRSPTGAPEAPLRLSYWVYAPPESLAGGSP
jgi:hypothetical protein